MNKNIRLSAISLALMSLSATAAAAELTAVKNSAVEQNVTTVEKSAFSQWYASEQSQKRSAMTDQIIVNFKSKAMLDQLKAGEAGLSSLQNKGESVSRKGELTSAKAMMRAMSASAGAPLSFVKAMSSTSAVMKIGKERSLESVAFLSRALSRNSMIESVEADPRRYPLAQNSPWGLADVQADLLSDSAAGNITVCVVDSGYERVNPDLPSGSNVSGTNDSGTGNWFEAGGSHGSHVAGTIAAMNNDFGVQGVLPNNNVNLHIIKVFNEQGYAYSSGLVAAVQACQDAGADVVNMSLGGPSFNSAENSGLAALANSGMLLIAAAGNDGDSTHSYPASYDSVVSVAAVDENNQHANFSQFTNQVELSGPGEAILSTVAGDGRQGYIAYGSTTVGDDRVAPHTRFTPSGSSFSVNNYNGSATGQLASCTVSGSSHVCGDMSGKICVVERIGNQIGSTYPDFDAAKACADAGAAGIVVYSNSERPGLQNPFMVDRDVALSTTPTVSVNRELGQQLVAAAGTTATLDVLGNRDYDYYNGTSMATPHVAGVAALVWSNNRTCTADQVRTALKETAIDLDSAGRDDRTGYGLVQAKAASDYLAANNCGTGSGGGTGGGTGDTSVVENLSASRNNWLNYTYDVPAGSSSLTVSIAGGTGDADLYVRFGQQPTTSSYDCRPFEVGNNETCSFNNPTAGTHHIGIRAYSTFSGVTLTASYE